MTTIFNRLGAFGVLAFGLSGCIAYTVADTAVSVVSTTVETTVDVAAGAVDLVVGDDD
ncbi:hypothetical protein KHP62_19940 [Rhodobacteraceae bacterium NNCM2]|nr:hypothetical protein [Coraliihabitans acroporae]